MSIVMSLWTTATTTIVSSTQLPRSRGGYCFIRRRFYEKSRYCGLHRLFIGRSSCTRTSHASTRPYTTTTNNNNYTYYSSDAAPGAATAAGSVLGGTRRKRGRAYYYYSSSSSSCRVQHQHQQQQQHLQQPHDQQTHWKFQQSPSSPSSASASAPAQTGSNVRSQMKSQSPAPSASPILSVLTSPHKLAERLECRQAAARTARFRRDGHSSLSGVGDHHHYDRNSWSNTNKWTGTTTTTTTSSSSSSSSSTSLYRNVTTESNASQPPPTYHSLEEGPRLLCLDIQRYRMDLAVVGHPFENDSLGCISQDAAAVDSAATSFVPVPSIPTPSRTITSCTISKLWDIVQQHQICGFLVHWPIQQDTLKFGAACGRVIFTLEKLQTESMVNPDDRPVCLFPTTVPTTTTAATIGLTSSPAVSTMIAQKNDKWGRCAGYGRTRPVYEDDLRHLRAMFHQDDGQIHDNDPKYQGQDQEKQEHEDIYYYDALRGRYFGGGSSHSVGRPSETDPSSSFSLFSDMPSSSDLPITTKLWDQFCATSWPSASSKSPKKHQASSFIIDGEEASSPSSSQRTSSWTRPSRCKMQRSGSNSRWKRKQESEFHDDYEEVEQSASCVRVPTKNSSKHLLVDRALRQAASSSTSTAATTTATAQAA